MAAGEHQAKAIIGDLAGVVIWFFSGTDQAGGGVRFEFLLEPLSASNAVNRLVPGCLNNPCPRELGNAGGSPLVHGGGKCFLRSLFGQVEVADQPNQGGHNLAPIGAVNIFYSPGYV